MDVEVRKSDVSGFGLFAKREFLKGQRIYYPIYFKIPKAVMEGLMEYNTNVSNGLMIHKIWGERDDYVISLNIDQYINHSSDPNCCEGIATKDIKEGDEIFEDYSLFDNEEWFHKKLEELKIWNASKK